MATTQPNSMGEQFVDLHFPLGGLSLQYGFDRQPNVNVGGGFYGRTAIVAKNVRVFDPRTDRARGGQRPGLVKFIEGTVNGATAIQEIASVTQMEGTVPGSGTLIDVFLGFVRGSNVPGAYNSLRGETADILFALAPPGTLYNPLSVSAIAFVTGGANPSYTAYGFADGAGITHSLYTVEDDDVSKYVYAVNQQRLANPQTIPGTLPDIVARCAVPSGSTHVIAALQRGADAGKLVVAGVTTSGTMGWSATSVVTTSESLSVITSTFPYGYFPYGIWSCVTGTYLLVLCPQNTGLVRCLVADGTSGSVVTTKAAINAMAGGDYSITGVSTCEQGIAATSAGVAAVVLHGTETVDGVLTRAAALAFITASTGASAFSATTGLATEPEIPAALATKQSTTVVTDGTHFYVATTPTVQSGSTYSCVIRKIKGTDGTTLWTKVLPTYNAVRMVYVSGLTRLEVYGSSYSAALNATTGEVVGSGTLTDASSAYLAICDAGSLTPGAVSIETGSEAGPRDILVAVSGGTIKVAYGGSWRSVTSGTAALSTTTPCVRSAPQNGYLYFVDGVNYKRYNPRDNTMATWAATLGTLPTDALGNAARLICLWNGRIVLSGLPRDDRNWFMSAQDDAEDFDFGPANQAATDATAGNNGPLGKVGDTVTALIPFTNDILLFGGDHSIYALRGDPLFGGKLDLLTDMIGMPFGNPWCKDPAGNLYFFSVPAGVYRMGRDAMPVPISQNIYSILRDLDLTGSTIRLLWDDAYQGLHVFVTPQSEAAATHFFWEARANAWTTTVLADTAFSPLCVYTYEDPARPGQSGLVGSFDGYVRSFSPTSGTDDGLAVDSEVWVGPLTTKDLDEIMIHDLLAHMGEESGSVSWAVHIGRTPEAARSSTEIRSGTWVAGRNRLNLVRRSNHALYLKITASNYWAMESVTARIQRLGMARRRGY